MLGFDIVDGVGTLRKQQFKNPYWRGVTTIGTVLGTINTDVIDVIVRNCGEKVGPGGSLQSSTLLNEPTAFESYLIRIPAEMADTDTGPGSAACRKSAEPDLLSVQDR